MKRSPPTSSCSSSNSSTSCIGFDNKPTKSKRSRTTRPHKQCHKSNATNNNTNTNSSSSSISNRRSSIYRGVTRHRWTGRFEAHLWDKSSWNNIQNKKGKQVYLGAYDNEEAAAHTYDLAALKYWGPETTLNFPIETYTNELQEMQKVTKEEYLASLRRRSSGFSRGVSKYRGVARHHHNGRWEARIGRVLGNKYLYLGTYNTQEEAAAAYDMAAIEYRGPTAVTNFDISHYIDRLKEKGIPLDHILEEPVPNCPAESEEAEAEVEQPPPPPENQQEQETASNSQLQSAQQTPPCVDTTSSMIAMDPLDDHELTWGFCLDSGLTTLPVANLPLENSCELPDLFDNAGFADNIDLIFEACSFETNYSNTTYASDDNILGCGAEEIVDVPDNMEEESGKEALLLSPSSSSPSCSTTTDVSCDYTV